VENAEFDPDKPISEMRCLLEQGYMCMGPVTAAGCAQTGRTCLHRGAGAVPGLFSVRYDRMAINCLI
jgi:coenzyme F420-reducing hydrogenase gamma subunit